MDPVSASIAGLGALVGFGSSAYQMSQQKSENAENRKFQKEMAQYQTQQNERLYNKNNAYNTPAMQISRYKAAGLNPALMYGGSAPAVGFPAVSAGASGGSGSVGGNFAPFDATSAGLSLARQQAEIENIKANTDKTKGESAIVWSDSKIRDSYNQGLLSMQNLNIRLGDKQIEATDTEIKKIQADIERINSENELLQETVDRVKAEIQGINLDNIGKAIDNVYKDAHWKSLIADLQSSIKLKNAQASLSYAQANEVLTLLSLKALDLENSIDLKRAMGAEAYQRADTLLAEEFNIRQTGRILEIDADVHSSIGHQKGMFQYIGSVLACSQGAVGLIGKSLVGL